MVNRNFATSLAAAALAMMSATAAAESSIPSSVSESRPFSFQPADLQSDTVRSNRQVTPPLSVSEAPAFSFSDDARAPRPAALDRAYGQAFPSAAKETGSSRLM